MAQRIKTEPVNLNVGVPVEIEKGVALPAGSYQGKRKTIGLETHQGMIWTAPQYLIELTAESLTSFGVKIPANLSSVEYDVTKFVHSGKISVLG